MIMVCLPSTVLMYVFIFLEIWAQQSNISNLNSMHEATYQICIYIIAFQ